MPETIPVLTPEELAHLGTMETNAAVAKLLNIWLDTPITGWDLDFSVGRKFLRTQMPERKLLVGEGWHNPEGSLDYLTHFLAERLSQSQGLWGKIMVRIAVLGVCVAQKITNSQEKAEKIDLAVMGGDFSGVLAGAYLKRMGFPVGTLVCCCNENNRLWELVHLGGTATGGVTVATRTPELDVLLPQGLEHWLYLLGGSKAAVEYAQCVYMGEDYTPGEELLKCMRQELYVSVVSDRRMEFTLETAGTLLSPYDALIYAGVQDYRAKNGEYVYCLMLSEKSPALCADTLAQVLHTTPDAVLTRLRR